MFGNRDAERNPFEKLTEQINRALMEATDSISFYHYSHVHNNTIIDNLQMAQLALMDASTASASHTAIWEEENGEACQ